MGPDPRKQMTGCLCTKTDRGTGNLEVEPEDGRLSVLFIADVAVLEGAEDIRYCTTSIPPFKFLSRTLLFSYSC